MEAAARELAAEKAKLWEEYITAGDVADFEADWPQLRRRFIADRGEPAARGPVWCLTSPSVWCSVM